MRLFFRVVAATVLSAEVVAWPLAGLAVLADCVLRNADVRWLRTCRFRARGEAEARVERLVQFYDQWSDHRGVVVLESCVRASAAAAMKPALKSN